MNINDCCVDYDKYKLYTFRNFMVYLGKHTMPVFLFKGEKKQNIQIILDLFFTFFQNMFFTDILPKLRAEFTFRSRIANLASNMIRLVLLDEIYWTNILQNSFSAALRIQETGFCGTSRKKRGQDQEVESQENVQVGGKNSFQKCSSWWKKSVLGSSSLLTQGHNSWHL